MLIVPFLLGYNRVDHYVMQFLPKHPKYEMMETTTERKDEPLSRFFITERIAGR